MRNFVLTLALTALAIAGCSSPVVPAVDAGPDVGSRSDGGPIDATTRDGDVRDGSDGAVDLDGAGDLDGASELDATADTDGAIDFDGAVDPDAGTPSDAAVGIDAGPDDAGTGSDAGADGGGAVDAGASDGGPDAGPVTTCAIDVTPTSGTTATMFTVTTASNGTTCQIQADGGPMLMVPCNNAFTSAGSFIGPGMHTLTLLVADGPSGATSCSAMVTITAAPTCSIDASPTSGSPSTAFDLTWTSSGTTCILDLPDGRSMTVPCNGGTVLSGLTLGMQPITLNVSGGPGATMCSVTITVSSTPTTCSVMVEPPTGSASTTFVATFASNGSMCTASVDGFGLGTVPCTGMFSAMGSMVPAGTHTVQLDVAAGPGGPTSCTDTFTVTP